MLRGPGEVVQLLQTEEAQYKLGGLLLVIEGIGRANHDGTPVLQALGVISYDDEDRTYRMRAFNDGRYLECELQLAEDGAGLTWGFQLGEIRTRSVLRVNEKGQWTEQAELLIDSQPPRRLLELRVSRCE